MLDKLKRFLPASLRPKMYLVRLVRRETKCRVQHGPFAGLDLGPDCSWLPALLGTYEKELWPVVSEIVEIAPDTIVNIGAAEGYYAVGFARLLPGTKVLAFEMDEHVRATLAQVVDRNGVNKAIEIRGKCDVPALARALQNAPRSLVICDVEGYESVLLDPAKVPELRGAYILVEVHDFIVAGVSQQLRDRFAGSHDMREIGQLPRAASDFPYMTSFLRLLPSAYRKWAVRERWDDNTVWFFMSPKSAAA